MGKHVVLALFALLVILGSAGVVGAQPLPEDDARHLLKRTTLRFQESDLEQLMERGTANYLAEELQDAVGQPKVRLPHIHLEPHAIYLMLLDEPEATKIIEREMQVARIVQGVQSTHQLREVMTDFWFNHFNADPDKGAVVACNVGRLERELRASAFGSFRKLLEIAVRNPAVLENLDNSISVGTAVNENFGRELMELYTTGPVHSQKDVVEMARCFSGWSYDQNPESPSHLQFRYYPELHSLGPKVVFGRTFSDHSQDEVLDFLATHPTTALFISRKLVTRFVDDDPPPALVDLTAKRYLETDGNIGEVLTCILSSPEFFDSVHHNSKLKSPLEFMVSAIFHSGNSDSVLDALIDGDPVADQLLGSLNKMGSPYSCPNPLGWPDSASTWTSGVGQRQRWTTATTLAERATPPPLKAFLNEPLSPSTARVMVEFKGSPRARHAAALVSPEFQSR